MATKKEKLEEIKEGHKKTVEEAKKIAQAQAELQMEIYKAKYIPLII